MTIPKMKRTQSRATMVSVMPRVGMATGQEKQEGETVGFPAAGGELERQRSAPSTGRKFCRYGPGPTQSFFVSNLPQSYDLEQRVQR